MSGGAGKIVKTVTDPLTNTVGSVFKLATGAPDTSSQSDAILQSARQQAEQSAEAARAAANSQASAAQREQLLQQRSEEEKNEDDTDADVRVGSDTTVEAARKRRAQFAGDQLTDTTQSPSIRI